MASITKRETQIVDENQIIHILDTAKVLNLGLAVDNMPYVVPMNYGYTLEDGKLVFYLHSAVKGNKLDMIRSSPNEYLSMDGAHKRFEGEKPCQYGVVYSSVMGKGTAALVEDVEEKKKAMSILMKTQTGKDFSFDDRLVSIVSVIRIDASEYKAKVRLVPERLR